MDTEDRIIELEINHYAIRLLIDDLPHLYILRDQFIGFQSWYYDDTDYCIEFQLLNGTILCEYADKSIWIKILGLLDEQLR
jgi:hypothetical protein